MKRKIAAIAMGMMIACAGLAGCGNKASESTAGTVESQSPVESRSTVESSTESSTAGDAKDDTKVSEDAAAAKKAAFEESFLEKANEVVVGDTTVTFTDNSSEEGTELIIEKNPQKVVVLYGSFTTLWYEAGGTVAGCVGGDSTIELYREYIGRDITQDEGMIVAATSSSGKKWDVESILALQPDLIICSTAMSGYSTISEPAAAANVPVIAVSYNDFSDYLKWFKVFCNLNGQPELWDSVAVPALEQVCDILASVPEEGNPSVFVMFAGSDSLQANTGNTVVGAMVDQLGATNIVDSWDNPTGADRLEINLETVYAANPDIIVIQTHDDEAGVQMVQDTYGDNPVWQELSAVKNDQVYFLEKSLFHNKPNSRFAEAYETLKEILYPGSEK